MCTQKNRHVVLASPSFPLYENHCRYAHIPWELWPLDDQHAYHLDALPKLSAGSVVIFASPNNPTGSVLPYKDLELLLHTYPDVLFVADEAYGAFTDQDYGPLILKHPHLILIRTFSKSWAMAGLRLGYTLAQAPWIHELRKMCVPFIISPFAALALRYALEHSHLQGYLKDQAHQTVLERTRLYLSLQNLNYVKVYPSEANFLLLEFSSTEVKASYVQQLASASILARDVGGSRGLSRCLRLSLATPMIHDLVLNVLRTPLSP
jgi:histidinol-phosphate aminotransferase